MGRITFGISVESWPRWGSFRVRFFFLALLGGLQRLEYWAQQFLLRRLLFDNLVSDLQIFLLAKTVLGGGNQLVADGLPSAIR
jgi:hypothetical protein